MNFVLRKLGKKHVWKRIFHERLCEPIHLNLLSVLVAIFGSFRAKVAYDLVVRQQHAFGLLQAADWAKECGIPSFTAIEFGVANGAGLVNMCDVAKKVTKATGIEINVVGFDTGTGMPWPTDYRDHPEAYRYGDYPMQNPELLKRRLDKEGARLILGNVRDTCQGFLQNCVPIGFISIDVDYYSSTLDAFEILKGGPGCYLPWIVIYMDDIDNYKHNEFCGELGAARDFSAASTFRKITKANFLRPTRIFQRPWWIEKMYVAHILDHPYREKFLHTQGTEVLDNLYL